MLHDYLSIIAVVFAGFTLVVAIGKDLFGGGSKLASSFSNLKETLHLELVALERKAMAEVASVRNEFYHRVEEMQNNYRIGLDAITANIHALQTSHLEFRAKMAEEYMRRDSFYKATDELKRDFNKANDEIKLDMKEGFARVEKTLETMSLNFNQERKG